MLPHSFSKLLFVLSVSYVFAAPSVNPIDTSRHCGQWDSVPVGSYSLLLDLWGMEHATSGSACASVTSLSGTNVAWTTTWNWAGDGIKGYTNMQLDVGVNKRLLDITSIPATWQWHQENSGSVVSNVAYDLFTSATAGGKKSIEIMIWLANFHANPISASVAIDGTPISIASNIPLAGHNWNLYHYINDGINIYSFLPSDPTSITSFKGDLNKFLQYLTSHQGVSTSQFLTIAQGGTEATSGSATFTSQKYSLVIKSK